MSFDPVARWYRLLETAVFGGALQRARTAFLSQVHDREQALIVGEGDGRFLRELVGAHPALQIDCVDQSGAMLRLAKAQVGGEGEPGARVRFHQASIREWLPAERYDLVVTHFVLDCFNEKETREIIARLSDCAAENASWLVAEFTIPAHGSGRFVARMLIPIMYAFFRATTGITARVISDHAPFLREHGFVRVRAKSFYAGIVRSELWERGYSAA